jgi:ArsR family transcriptional regulator
MDKYESLAAFSALSNAPRLDAFRLLIKAGEAGLPSGEIAERLGAKQNSTSTNLAILQSAGLIHSQRDGRSVKYRADMSGVRGLLEFLMEDCCGGNPELCRPILDEVTCCE